MKTKLAIAAFAVVLAGTGWGQTFGGQQEIDACSKVPPTPTGNVNDTVTVTHCGAYIVGVIDGMYLAGIANPKSGERWNSYCLRESVTIGQLMQVVQKYLRDHPEKLDIPPVSLVAMALHNAFPCPTGK